MTSHVAYPVAAMLFLAGVAHLVVSVIDGGPWEGPVSWRKPVTFGLTLATYAWVAGFVRLRPVWVAVFAVAVSLVVAMAFGGPMVAERDGSW